MDYVGSADGGTISGATKSFSYNSTGGEDHVLAITIGVKNTAPTDVTFNGDAAIKEVEATNGLFRASVWYLVNPDSGNYTVSLTGMGFSTAGSVGIVEFSGVNTATPIDDSDVSTGTGSPSSVSLTTKEDSEYLVSALAVDGFWSSDLIPSGSQVEVHNDEDFSVNVSGGYQLEGVADDVSIGWTWTETISEAYATVAVAFKAGGIAAEINDSVGISEEITVAVTNLGGISLDESLSVAESLSLSIGVSHSTASSLSISEFIDIDTGDSSVVEAGDISVTENVSIVLKNFIVSVAETVSLSENLNPEKDPIELIISEDVSIEETVTAGYTRRLFVYDDLFIEEDIPILPPGFSFSVYSEVIISEDISQELVLKVFIGEEMTIEEEISSSSLRQGHSYGWQRPRGDATLI